MGLFQDPTRSLQMQPLTMPISKCSLCQPVELSILQCTACQARSFQTAALVLGNFAASGEDGLLQAREIRDRDLRADLVVLSECETGGGKLLGEEGIVRLERALLLAGAKSVIASL